MTHWTKAPDNMSKKVKDYLELANDRYNDNKKAKQDKVKLDRDKFNWQRKKDIKNAVITIICGLPIVILVISFVII